MIESFKDQASEDIFNIEFVLCGVNQAHAT